MQSAGAHLPRCGVAIDNTSFVSSLFPSRILSLLNWILDLHPIGVVQFHFILVSLAIHRCVVEDSEVVATAVVDFEVVAAIAVASGAGAAIEVAVAAAVVAALADAEAAAVLVPKLWWNPT